MNEVLSGTLRSDTESHLSLIDSGVRASDEPRKYPCLDRGVVEREDKFLIYFQLGPLL
jgi:hypothetical protein